MDNRTTDQRNEFFLMILFPFGPKPMVTETDDSSDPKVSFFPTAHDAHQTARQSRACVAYGYEVFRIGNCDYEE